MQEFSRDLIPLVGKHLDPVSYFQMRQVSRRWHAGLPITWTTMKTWYQKSAPHSLALRGFSMGIPLSDLGESIVRLIDDRIRLLCLEGRSLRGLLPNSETVLEYIRAGDSLNVNRVALFYLKHYPALFPKIITILVNNGYIYSWLYAKWWSSYDDSVVTLKPPVDRPITLGSPADSRWLIKTLEDGRIFDLPETIKLESTKRIDVLLEKLVKHELPDLARQLTNVYLLNPRTMFILSKKNITQFIKWIEIFEYNFDSCSLELLIRHLLRRGGVDKIDFLLKKFSMISFHFEGECNLPRVSVEWLAKNPNVWNLAYCAHWSFPPDLNKKLFDSRDLKQMPIVDSLAYVNWRAFCQNQISC